MTANGPASGKADFPVIHISVKSEHMPDESTPEEEEHVFRYTITLTNEGVMGAKLTDRAWTITDANNQIQRIRGQGVSGKQPHLKPGESFEYTSFVVMATDLGTMQGHYLFVTDDKRNYKVPIPLFVLANPKRLH